MIYIFNNVERFKLFDNGREVEDVVKVDTPEIKHKSSTIGSAGMVMELNAPTQSRYEASDFTVTHNNGTNCRYLNDPGQHQLELRVARQRYNVATGKFEYSSVFFRITGIYMTHKDNSVELDNPYGSTVTFSVLAYEKLIDGQTVEKIDTRTGVVEQNGVSLTDEINVLLD